MQNSDELIQRLTEENRMPRYFRKSQEDLCKVGDLFLDVLRGQNRAIRRDTATVSDYFNSFSKPVYETEVTGAPFRGGYLSFMSTCKIFNISET